MMINIRTATTGITLFAALMLGALTVHAATQHATQFTVTFAGADEVPAVITDGKGTARVTLNAKQDMLKWKITYSGLSGPVTGAHFHGPAAAGESAGVAIPLTGALTSPVSGHAKLTPAQVADLLAGKWYLNLHTAAHPNGEVRGQVVPKT